MTRELSPELRQAMHQLPSNEPLRVVDPDTNEVYFLVRAEVFEQVQSVLKDDVKLAATYTAQSEAALTGGWGEKKMAEYDNYDDHHNDL